MSQHHIGLKDSLMNVYMVVVDDDDDDDGNMSEFEQTPRTA